jgi:hypothetical protein
MAGKPYVKMTDREKRSRYEKRRRMQQRYMVQVTQIKLGVRVSQVLCCPGLASRIIGEAARYYYLLGLLCPRDGQVYRPLR